MGVVVGRQVGARDLAIDVLHCLVDQRDLDHRLRIGAVVVAIASIVCAGAVNVSAESAPKRASNTLDARQIAELQAIADWAREQGLTGLSPALLRPID